MKNSDETFEITKEQIKDMYAMLKRLFDSYSEKESNLSDADWLARQYQIAFLTCPTKKPQRWGTSR